MGKYQVHQTDKSEPLIIEAMQKAGASVWKIGRPVDLVVACQGQTALAECKTGKAKLEPAQASFIAAWPGITAVLRTPEDGIALVQQLKGKA